MKKVQENVLYLPLSKTTNKLADLLHLSFNQSASTEDGIWEPRIDNHKVRVPSSTIVRRMTGNAPEVIVCQLLRYQVNPCQEGKADNLPYTRLNTIIELPEDGLIDISRFMNEKTERPVKYRLRGCVDHHGNGINSGHYTAFTCVEDQWYYANDDLLISPVTFEEVKKAQHYIYLFEKIS